MLAIALMAGQITLAADSPEPCPRPAAGGAVAEPESVSSRDGELHVDLTVRNSRERDGSLRYCYVLPDGAQSPTLRVKPGDQVVIALHNELKQLGDAPLTHVHHHPVAAQATDPCSSGAMTAVSANLHFHGLTLPPLCHQDEVL
jgi:FtsP/CotA-like multicopper oxidase with cupredoxin domain